jgi:hypothetical protein
MWTEIRLRYWRKNDLTIRYGSIPPSVFDRVERSGSRAVPQCQPELSQVGLLCPDSGNSGDTTFRNGSRRLWYENLKANVLQDEVEENGAAKPFRIPITKADK